MDSEKTLKSVIKSINTNKKFPALKLLKDNLQNAAVVSKLIRDDSQKDFDLDNEWASQNVNSANIKYLAHQILDNKRSSENLLELFPDMEISIQILVSSVLSPKDMTNTDIIYTINDSFLSSEITGAILNIIKEQVETVYKIDTELYTILREVLFEVGSYSLLVIPESSLDELINRNTYITTEHLRDTLLLKNNQIKTRGILGNPKAVTYEEKGLSLEAFGEYERLPYEDYQYNMGAGEIAVENNKLIDLLSFIQVTDNIEVLKMPRIINRNNEVRLKHQLAKESDSLTGYSVGIPESNDLTNLLYKRLMPNTVPFVALKDIDNTKRNSVGRPLVLNLPAEAVLPIFTPGNEKEHIGYFVMIDSEGHPLNKNSLDMTNLDNLNGTTFMNANMNSPDLTNFITNKTAYNLNGSPTSGMDTRELTTVFANIIENDLINRLKNGIYKTKLEVGKIDEVYKIMLFRALAGQQTQLLFVPSSNMTYFAYKYHQNGVGKSLMEDVKVLNSLRAMTMFARIMASIRNSVGVTEVKLHLSDKDPDPQKTIEIVMHEIMKTRQQFFPLGINSPSDLSEWVQRSGFQFTFDGHPKIPDMNLDFEQKGYTNVKPDEELDEELRRRSILAFGLSPETVDSGFAAEFATTVVNNNILLSKRVTQIQQAIMPFETKFVKQLVLNDMVIYNEIIAVLDNNEKAISKNFEDDEKKLFKENKYAFYNILINKLLEKFEVSLPNANTTTLDTQMTALTQYIEALEKGLDAWISNEAITSNLMGEIADDVDALKATVKSYYIRKYMTENNILPELNDLTLSTDEGKPKIDLFDIQKDHLEGLLNSSAKFIKSLSKVKDKLNKTIGVQSDDAQAEFGEPSDTGVDNEIETAGEEGVDDIDLASGGTDEGGDDGAQDDKDNKAGDDDAVNEPNPDDL